MANKTLIQLESKEIEGLREKLLKEQNYKCALTNEDLSDCSGISLDHQHKFSYENNGDDGAGLIRGVLGRSSNVWEGKIWNNTNRYFGRVSVNDRIILLEKLIKYYKKGTFNIIHPSEKIKELKLSKRNYNKLKKLYIKSKTKKKFPEYPKSKKLTISLKILYELFGIEPYNIK